MYDITDGFRPHGRLATPLAMLLVVVCLGTTSSSCRSYRSTPLPALADVAHAPALDEAAARTALRELDNPLLAPATVVFSEGLSPRQIGALAAALNPDIQALRRRHAEAQAEVLRSRLLPNPIVDTSSEQPSGSGSAGLSAAYGIAVSIGTQELLTRGARTRGAEARLKQVDLVFAWRQWQVAQQARLEALRLGWLQQRLATVSSELDLQAQITKLVADAVASGDATIDQATNERAVLESLRAALSELERARARTHSHLLGLLGVAELPEARIRLVDVPEEFSPRPSLSELLPRCLARRLDLAALRAGYQVEEERLRQAILEQFPAITVGLSHSRDETSLKFFGGLVSLDVPVFGRNQSRVTKQQATRARVAAEYRARALDVRAAVAETNDLIETIDRRLPELRAALKPLSRNEAAERQAVQWGDVDRLSYRSARMVLLNQRLLVASLSQARGEALIGLEAACGGAPEVLGTAEETR